MVSIVTIHTGSIIWIYQVIFRNADVYTQMHMQTITTSEKKGDIFGRSVGRNMWKSLEGLIGKEN